MTKYIEVVKFTSYLLPSSRIQLFENALGCRESSEMCILVIHLWFSSVCNLIARGRLVDNMS